MKKNEMIYFTKYIPYIYNDYCIRLLNRKTANKYVNNILTEKYNEFNAIDFREYTYESLMQSCLTLLGMYENNIPTTDVRLVIYNKDRLISGVTIYGEHSEYKTLTLGYFIFDEYIGQGYGNITLKSVLNYIKYVKELKDLDLSTIILKIKQKNNRSIKIAVANGFCKYKSDKEFDIYKYNL